MQAGRQRLEDVIIRTSAVAAGLGAVLLIAGEGLLNMQIYALGLAVTVASVLIYYCSG